MKGTHVFDGMKRPLVGLGLPIKFSAMTGHFRSAISRKPVDGRGNPIPWYSYPAIHFLSSINWEDCRVLEFGSGYSTLWWAARAGHVTTIEGDPEWFRVVQSKGGQFPNVRAIFRDDHLAHARAPLLLDENFDVVVVDGGDRYLCAESAAQVVASDGLIVLDDSEGFWGQEGTYPIIELLQGLGFGRVDYYGFRPCGWHLGCTSLFFRAGTKLFLIQEGADPHTAHNLKYLAKVSGAVYFQFDPRTQERHLAEMVEMVSVFAAGGENAVKAKGGEAATLLLEHLTQEPMPILEKEPERVKVKR